MTQTFIPGYLAEIQLTLPVATDVDLTVVGNVLSLDITKSVLPKPVFGQQWRNSAAGQLSGAISAGGHLSVEIAGDLFDLIETQIPVEFEIHAGDTTAGIDAGTYTGEVVTGSLSISSDAEGEWEWTLDGETNGPVVFTPAV